MDVKILIVDDSVEISMLIQEYLDVYFSTYLCENGEEALKYIETSGNPDLIISDIEMPVMDGYTFANHLKAGPITKNIPILILSSLDDSSERIKFLRLGVDDYLVKPFNPDELLLRVEAILKRGGLDIDIEQLAKKKSESELDCESGPSLTSAKYRLPLFKRLFDILFSLAALTAIFPILLIAVIAIRLESKGKVYYISKRVGTGYRIFNFYKLRSMRVGADKLIKDMAALNQYQEPEKEESDRECSRCKALGEPCSPILIKDGEELCEWSHLQSKIQNNKATFIKIKDDPRVTKVGRFIRNTSIDELPQLFNVLKGDMSIVGNRPLPLYEAEMLTTDEWSKRFMAPAGITGLWQVEKRGRAEKMSPTERKELDNRYAEHSSLIYDATIILRTVKALFQSENV